MAQNYGLTVVATPPIFLTVWLDFLAFIRAWPIDLGALDSVAPTKRHDERGDGACLGVSKRRTCPLIPVRDPEALRLSAGSVVDLILQAVVFD